MKQQHAKNPIAIATRCLEQDGALHERVGLSWTYKGPLEPMPLEEQETMSATDSMQTAPFALIEDTGNQRSDTQK